MAESVLILGGYGSTGLPLARLLLQRTSARVAIAGRHDGPARAAAAALATDFGAGRVSWTTADARDEASVRRAIRATEGCRVLVVASPTSDAVDAVAGAALAEGVDYLDLQLSTARLEYLRAMADEIAAAGCCFVTDGGFHPGLPAVLVRLLADRFDPGEMRTAVVGSVIAIDWTAVDPGADTMSEFVRELADYQAVEYRDGAWGPARWWTSWLPRKVDFGPRFGRRTVAPMFLEEMRSLPAELPGLTAVGFDVGGFNWFVDYLVMPVGFIAFRVFGDRAVAPLGRVLGWGLRRFSRPPYGTMLRARAAGRSGGRPVVVTFDCYHPDGYLFTAIPVAACLEQLLDGTARRPGLFLQAEIVDPRRMLVDLAAMGIEVTWSERPAAARPERFSAQRTARFSARRTARFSARRPA